MECTVNLWEKTLFIIAVYPNKIIGDQFTIISIMKHEIHQSGQHKMDPRFLLTTLVFANSKSFYTSNAEQFDMYQIAFLVEQIPANKSF